MSPRVRMAWFLSAALFGAGCGRVAKDSGSPVDNAAAGMPSATGGSPDSSGAAGSAASLGYAGSGGSPLNCTGTQLSPGPLSGLDGFELSRSMVDALREAPQVVDSSALLARDWPSGEQELGSAEIEAVHAVAHEAALKLSQDETLLQSVTGCDWHTGSSDDCRDTFLGRFLPRVYRRALVAEDRDEMTAVFQNGMKLGGDFASGVRAVVEVALQSPDFMYLIELGQNGAAPARARALTGYETAARLAYFLTAAPPDDELFAAAAKGPLKSSSIETQARRLLGSPKSREAVRRFYSQRFLGPDDTSSPTSGYPDGVAALAREESARFVEDVTFDGAGTFSALLTEPSTWVNGPLAKFYGYGKVTGDEFRKIQLDPKQRGGLFTQSAFLHANSKGGAADPVRRGVSILRNVLCMNLPPPPPNVIVTVGNPVPGATLRMTLEQATAPQPCRSCHAVINPVGFAFEHYDAYGRWLDTDQGQPIDSSGDLDRTDAAGPFQDAPELMAHIAKSNDAQTCFVTSWLDAAYRRNASQNDECTIAAASKAFAESDGKLVDLMVTLAESDRFRYRLASELPP
ncbi:MAG: DUF1588 domain-containing protein [Pseudomonadota bacterium]